MPAANDNKSEGEWVLAFIPARFLAALDRYMREETKFEGRSDALQAAFQDWCIHMGYVSPNEMDRDFELNGRPTRVAKIFKSASRLAAENGILKTPGHPVPEARNSI